MLFENEYNILLKRAFYNIISSEILGFIHRIKMIQLYLSQTVIFRLWKYQKCYFPNVQIKCIACRV